MDTHGNLLGPEPTLLPAREDLVTRLTSGEDPADVAAENPDFSAAWARLAEDALEEQQVITAYAYARTGYHRGLDQLRGSGWKGFGPVPWSHEPNRGFLRSVAALAKAADRIGEQHEYDRCRELIADCDPDALLELGL